MDKFAKHKNPLQHKFVGKILTNSDARFWGFNCIGWLGISIISYFSLNLWYGQPELGYIGHNVSQSILGLLLTWPMRQIFRSTWTMEGKLRLFLVVLTVLFLSAVWAALRLGLFQVMTIESNLWGDFGGWYYSSIFIFFCWAASYHVIKYYQLLEREHKELLNLEKARSEESLRLSQAENIAREAQLKMLRYQINPHFLFNTLNSLQALISTGRNEKATTMLDELSGFLRFSLDSDALDLIPLEQEVKVLEQYLGIEKTRFGSRLSVAIDIQEEAKSALVPSMLLQPLVENAIKYAVSPSEKPVLILIRAHIEDNELVIDVEDDGKGFPEAFTQTNEHRGIGLKNTRQRLDNFYGKGFDLKLRNKNQSGAVITITIPAQRQEEYAAVNHKNAFSR